MSMGSFPGLVAMSWNLFAWVLIYVTLCVTNGEMYFLFANGLH